MRIRTTCVVLYEVADDDGEVLLRADEKAARAFFNEVMRRDWTREDFHDRLPVAAQRPQVQNAQEREGLARVERSDVRSHRQRPGTLARAAESARAKEVVGESQG